MRGALTWLLFSASPALSAAEPFEDALHTYLQQCLECRPAGIGIVIGIVDEHGSRVFNYGHLDEARREEVSGDTSLGRAGAGGRRWPALHRRRHVLTAVLLHTDGCRP